jgi:hypothetical protein
MPDLIPTQLTNSVTTFYPRIYKAGVPVAYISAFGQTYFDLLMDPWLFYRAFTTA